MKRSKLVLYLTAILSFIGVCVIYQRLPEAYPTQFDMNWEVSSYAPKCVALLLGFLPFGLCIFREILPKIDPLVHKRKKREGAYDMIWSFTVIFLIGMDWISNLYALGLAQNISTVLPVTMGICFLWIGNYLPKVKSNFFLGIRTPWTLSNEVVWRKTHRFGGYIFVILGMLFIVTAAIQSSEWNNILAAVLFLGVAWMILYSYLCYRKEVK